MHEPIVIYSDCTRIEISNLPKGSQTSVQETQPSGTIAEEQCRKY